MAADSVPLPSSYESIYQRAESLVRSGQPGAAIELLDRMNKRLAKLSAETIEHNPQMARLAFRAGSDLADLLMAEGRYDDSIAVIRGLTRFAPEVAPLVARRVAMSLAAKGDLEQAQSELAAQTEITPDEAIVWLGLAEVLISRGLYDEAAAALDRAESAVQEAPLRAVVHHRRFVLFSRQGKTAEASTAWDAIAEHDAAVANNRSPQLYAYLLESGERELLRAYLRKESSKIRTEYYRGLLDHSAGEFAASTAKWEAVLKLNPYEDRLGALEWAEAALRLGRTQDALSLLVAASQDGASPRSLLLMAIGAARGGRVEQVRQLIERGARLLRASVPRSERYTRADWELFTSLVDNRELWKAVSDRFDTDRDGE